MSKDRVRKGRPQGEAPAVIAGKFEYDRADEKRKIQEEIEDVLEERQEKPSPSQG